MPLREDLIVGCLGAKEQMGPLQRIEALGSHLRLKQATPFLNPAHQLPGALCSLCWPLGLPKSSAHLALYLRTTCFVSSLPSVA